MNFRYHLLAIAFLSLVVHFQNNDEIVLGSISLAQSAPTTEATITEKSEKPIANRKTLRSRTKNGNSFTVILEERSGLSGLDELRNFLGKKDPQAVRTYVKVIDGAGVPVKFGECACLEEKPYESKLEDLANNEEFNSSLSTIEQQIDRNAEEKKKNELEAKQKIENCEEGSMKEKASCLESKLAGAKSDEKIELRNRLSDLIEQGLNEQGREDETLAFLKENKNILRFLDRNQAQAIKTLSANYLAGKSAFDISRELENRVQPLMLAAFNTNNPFERQQQLMRAQQALNRVQARTINSSQRKFEREYSNVFGRTQGSAEVKSAWTQANSRNAEIIQTYRDPTLLNEKILSSIQFMGDEYDISGKSIMSESQDSDDSQNRIRRNMRRNGDLHFGSNDYRIRPTLEGAYNFSAYVESLKRSTVNFGNNGLNSNLLESFRDPSNTNINQPSNQISNPPATRVSGRGGARPTGF